MYVSHQKARNWLIRESIIRLNVIKTPVRARLFTDQMEDCREDVSRKRHS